MISHRVHMAAKIRGDMGDGFPIGQPLIEICIGMLGHVGAYFAVEFGIGFVAHGGRSGERDKYL